MDIRKWALINAYQHEGKAQIGAVIGKLISDNVEVKERLTEIKKEIERVILEVNSLSFDEIKEIVEKNYSNDLNKPKKEHSLKELPNAVDGKVVLRFAPSPSGPLHIGHTLALSLSSAYAKKYSGKLLLRIEDTNPENLYPPAYELIERDARWLTDNGVAEVRIQSDHLSEYYDVCETLLHEGHAYVCTCDPDNFRALLHKSTPCPCRNLDSKEHVKRFALMFSHYKAGEAVVRIKTNIEDKNPAMRDWPAMRINDHEHPRMGTKHRVWPLMNFSVSVDDHSTRVTHSIRGKDHMDNAKKQAQLYKMLDWEVPTCMYIGRVNFEGIELSTTKTRLAIERGEFTGWSDPRIAFLPALRRRGFQPGAFRKFAELMGLSQVDKTVSQEEFFKTLNAFNKEIIDDSAPRAFVIIDPIKISIENAPKKNARVPVHPDHPERGDRIFTVEGVFYISKTDITALKKGEMCRLMGCYNFILDSETPALIFHSEEKEVFKNSGGKKIIHWLPAQEAVECRIVMPDNTIKECMAEKTILDMETGTVIQCERFGFCRIDSLEPLVLYYGHK